MMLTDQTTLKVHKTNPLV